MVTKASIFCLTALESLAIETLAAPVVVALRSIMLDYVVNAIGLACIRHTITTVIEASTAV